MEFEESGPGVRPLTAFSVFQGGFGYNLSFPLFNHPAADVQPLARLDTTT